MKGTVLQDESQTRAHHRAVPQTRAGALVGVRLPGYHLWTGGAQLLSVHIGAGVARVRATGELDSLDARIFGG